MRSGYRAEPRRLPRRQDRDPPDLERPEQRPVAVDEAQDTAHGHVLSSTERRLHDVDLSEDAVDELGPVGPTDEEMFGAFADEAAAALDRDPTLVALGVDDEYAARADRDVIQVRATPRNLPVMEEDDAQVGGPPLSFAASSTSPAAPVDHAR